MPLNASALAPCALALGALAALPASGAVLQTVTGPDVATGGGIGSVLIDTGSDTGDWIDGLNAGGTVFLAWDWTIDNNAGETGTGGFFGGIGVYDGTTERLLLGNGWENLDYSAGAAGTIETTGTNYAVGTTVRLVAELTTVNDGAGNDTWRFWVAPAVGDSGSPDAVRTDWTIDDITQLTHRAGNAPGSATLANLVVGETWGDVVPEPATAVLAGAGLLLMTSRRRHA